MRVLVLGATGLLGEPVAHGLWDAGLAVRVMSRDVRRARAMYYQPIEVVAGDAIDPSALREALIGCDAVHISIDHDREDECVVNVVEAAQAQGVGRITYVSGTTVCEANSWFPLVDRKLRSERAIQRSGIAYTIFCPGWFMEMLGHFVRRRHAIVFGTPSQGWHFVALEDFGRMVVQSYRCPDAVNKRFYVHGPEALTVLDALRSYCRALRPDIKTVHRVPYGVMRMVAALGRNAAMQSGLSIVSYLEQVGERGDPAEADAILGAPRLTLDEWLKKRMSHVRTDTGRRRRRRRGSAVPVQ